tara:strand:+ start:431 stop:1252 length:822 start_codon:yes stop_codon:yes gene_type:complete
MSTTLSEIYQLSQKYPNYFYPEEKDVVNEYYNQTIRPNHFDLFKDKDQVIDGKYFLGGETELGVNSKLNVGVFNETDDAILKRDAKNKTKDVGQYDNSVLHDASQKAEYYKLFKQVFNNVIDIKARATRGEGRGWFPWLWNDDRTGGAKKKVSNKRSKNKTKKRKNKTKKRKNKTKRINKSRRRYRKKSIKVYGGANNEILNEGDAKKYLVLLLKNSKYLESEGIQMHMVSAVKKDEEKTIKEILKNLNKDNKGYSINNLFDATATYIKEYKE